MVAEAEKGRVKNTTFLVRQTKSELREAVENAMILHPELPVGQVAALVAGELEKDALVEIAAGYVAQIARSIRRGQSRARTDQYRLPGMEHMPVRIFDYSGKRRNLMNATYRDVREYVKRIGSGYDKRRKNDPKFKEALGLLKKMRAAAKQNRGITVGELLGLT